MNEMLALVAEHAGLSKDLADRLTGITLTELSADAEELVRLVTAHDDAPSGRPG